ncbi:ankyrin [Azoarcus sp. CIB]|nr:ankyrin [Azoarcus sp. CIB]
MIGGAKRNQLDADGHDELWLAQMLGRHDVVTITEGLRAQRMKHPPPGNSDGAL